MKRCSVCREEKPEGEFHLKRGRPRDRCKVCQRAYFKDYYARLSTELKAKVRARSAAARVHIEALITRLKDRPCADCGNKFEAVAMDFDHVSGRKSFEIGSAARGGYSIERILAEVEKCEVVCACCHRIRTKNRNQCRLRSTPELRLINQ